MKETSFDWNLITWNDFETLTVYLSQDFFKKPFFEKYLKSGNRQRGIDIRDIDPTDKLPIFLQCKHEKLTIGNLKALVGNFTNESQWEKPCNFILATTSDLQNEALQPYIIEQQRILREIDINWFIWDVNFIEQELKKQFHLVWRFWGMEAARRYCWPPKARLAEYQGYPDFISRHISRTPVFGAPRSPYWQFESEETVSLTTLLTEPGGTPIQLCLVADAYEGKSVQLEQTAYELCRGESGFTPLLLRLKNATIAPIETLLEIAFDGWKTIPAQQLIILIDGLDEVPSDKFIDVVNHLSAFIDSHSFIRLLFSCRKLFYNQYELPKRLANVNFYELRPINYRQIDAYLQEKLHSRKDAFYNEIHRLDLEQFLAYPFYLYNLVAWYNAGSTNMPTSKIDVVNRFITESLDISAQRRLSGGLDLDKHRARYKQLIQHFALALQLIGKNAFDQEELQELFSPADLELLQAGSILSVDGKSWSFHNAIYQEQLAAMALTKFSAKKIIDMVSVGRQLRKIRIKWLQTLASYLSLLPENDPGKSRILQLIEQDNIELLTLTDAGKFSSTFRLDVIQRIFDKYIQLSARPIFATDKMLAAFVRNDREIIKYLLELLERDIPEVLKITACRTLAHIRLTKREIVDYGEIAVRQLLILSNPYFGKLLTDHLSCHCLGSPATKAVLLSRTELLDKQEYRDGIYRYLIAHDEVDAHYEIGLNGFSVLYRYNKDISHFNSENDLQEFLLSSTDPQNVKRLFECISDKKWQEFYQYKSHETTTFLNRLVDVAKVAYLRDSSILECVVRFIISIDRNHMKDEFRSIGRFFLETGTNRDAFIIYLNLDRTRLYSWVLCDILTLDCFPLLIEYAEQGRLRKGDLQSFVNGLYYKRRISDAESLQTLIDNHYGKEPVDEVSPEQRWQQMQQDRFESDYRYLMSVDSLREGVIAYFGAFGKSELEEDELYLDAEDKPTIAKVESEVLQDYLRRLKIKEQPVCLNDALKLLDNSKDFYYWRARKLLDYNFQGRPNEDNLKTILKDFYLTNIRQADFTNAYFYDADGTPMRKDLEYLLSEIWKKHQYETPDEVLLEMTWMETNGVRSIEVDELNRRTSLAGLIIQHFSDRPIMLRTCILRHMQEGICDNGVLASHIGFCQHLHLIEAAPFILDIIESECLGDHEQYQSIDVLVKLGGHDRDLLSYLEGYKDYNSYVFLHLIKLLRKDFPAEVSSLLQAAIENQGTNSEQRMEYAKYLANCGEFRGFDHIINSLEQNNAVPFSIQQDITIWDIDTAQGLERLESVSHMLVDPVFDTGSFWKSPHRFLLEILSGFAAKSEEDLLLIEKFMRKTANRNQVQFPTQAAHLRWHTEQILDRFRESQQTGFSISAIRQIFRDQSTNYA